MLGQLLVVGAVMLTALIASPASAQAQQSSRPETLQERQNRYDIQLNRCIEQVGKTIADRTGAPMMFARIDALKWCEQNVERPPGR